MRGVLFRPHPNGTQRLPGGARGDYWVSYVYAVGHRHRDNVGPKGLAREEHGRLRTKVRREAYCPAAAKRSRPIRMRGDPPQPGGDRDVQDRAAEPREGTGHVSRELALLRKMLALAVDWELLERHPMARGKGLQEPPGRLRYLSPEEVDALLTACAPHIRPIVVCRLHTGMRRGEILGLTWDQVDLRKRLIRVTRTKSGEARAIPRQRRLGRGASAPSPPAWERRRLRQS
jgi:integrase